MEQDESHNPPERDVKRRLRQRRQLSRKLGVDLPEWEDEGTAPAVDEAAIQGMLERTASQEEQQRVCQLIWRFRSWAEAYCRLSRKPSEE
jgi:hypothetical protein